MQRFGEFVHKYRNEILFSGFLFCLYFILRLSDLSKLPLFTDEAIYIRWAQIALHDASWRFISLTDGKGPFFIWVMMPFLKLIHDPIVAGRTVSAVAGFFTMIGLWFVTWELFKRRFIAFLAALLYVVFPMAVVYDRMALYDSMVATFAVWALYFSILLVSKVRLDIAYTLGGITGLGILTKANANFSLILLPFTLLLFDFKHKDKVMRFAKWVILALFAIIIAQVLYTIQRLSPLYGVINEKTATFVYPVSVWIHHPFLVFLGNLHSLVWWSYTYLTLSYVLLLIIGILFGKFLKEKLLLLIYFAAPFFALAFFGEKIYPRFLFFMCVFLLPLAAFGLTTIIQVLEKNLIGKHNKVSTKYFLTVIVVLCFIFYSAYNSYLVAFNPTQATIADSDRGQYIENWPAGWGVKESIDYFSSISQNQKIFIGTEGTFGLMPEAYEMYFYNNHNIITKGFWPINDTIPQELVSHAATMPTYVVFYQPCPACSDGSLAPQGWPVKEIFRVTKYNARLVVYQVESGK